MTKPAEDADPKPTEPKTGKRTRQTSAKNASAEKKPKFDLDTVISAVTLIKALGGMEEVEKQIKTITDFQAAIDPADLGRVMYAAAGLVSVPPIQKLPPSAAGRWLRTDREGLVPYGGAAADEREVRLWAWLAFARDAQLIQWKSVLRPRTRPMRRPARMS